MEEQQHISAGPTRPEVLLKSASAPAPQNERSVASSHLHSIVAAAAVHHDDLVDARRHGGKDLLEDAPFIHRGNDDRYLHDVKRIFLPQIEPSRATKLILNSGVIIKTKCRSRGVRSRRTADVYEIS